MQRAYVGESFEQSFTITDPKHPDRTVDSAQYVVYLGDAVADSGTMSVEGNTARFRFNARTKGVHRIEVSYRMGQDHFIEKFLMSVER